MPVARCTVERVGALVRVSTNGARERWRISRWACVNPSCDRSTGTTTESYRVDVDDCGEPGTADTFGIKTTTVLRFVTPAGAERAYQYLGDPGLVHLDPRWYHAGLQFVRLGIQHILSGIDHLLFVLCLVIPFRRIRPLVLIVTSFRNASGLL